MTEDWVSGQAEQKLIKGTELGGTGPEGCPGVGHTSEKKDAGTPLAVPVVKTPRLHRRERVSPLVGTEISHAVQCRQRKRRKTPSIYCLEREAPWRLKNSSGWTVRSRETAARALRGQEAAAGV